MVSVGGEGDGGGEDDATGEDVGVAFLKENGESRSNWWRGKCGGDGVASNGGEFADEGGGARSKGAKGFKDKRDEKR